MALTEVAVQYPELHLKIAPPRVSKVWVTREELSCLGPVLGRHQLLVVKGSSGYGKTTLLTQWRAELLRTGAHVIWLACDELDSDIRVLLCLAVALTEATGDDTFMNMVDEEAFIPSLTRILALIKHQGHEVALMLDDVHRWREATAQVSLQYLLKQAPSNLRIFLSTRPKHKLVWRELLAGERYTEITQTNLKLKPAAVLEVMQSQLGDQAGIDTAVKLYQLTAGWPLGVQLACASMALEPGAFHALLDRGEPSDSLEQYFIFHLIEKLTPDQISFLARVSLVERFTVDMATAMTDVPDAAALLFELTAATPVLEWNAKGEWFSVHALARQFLLQSHYQHAPEQRKQIQVKAALWCADQGLYEEAVYLAELCGKADLVEKWIEQALNSFSKRGDIRSLLYWKDRLALKVRTIRPDVLFAMAQTLAFSAKSRQVHQWVHQDYPDILERGANPYEREVFDASVELTNDCLHAAQTRLALLDADMIPVYAGRARYVHQASTLYLDIHSGCPFDSQELMRYVTSCPHDSDESRLYLFVLAYSLLWRGQTQTLITMLGDLQTAIELERGRHDTSATTLAVLLAAALWQTGKLEQAGILLADRINGIESYAPPPTLVEAFLVYIRVAAQAGQITRAEYLAGRLYDLGRTRKWPRAQVFAVRELTYLSVRYGGREKARELLRQFEEEMKASKLAGVGILEDLLQVQYALAQAHACMAERDWENARVAAAAALALAGSIRRPHDELVALCVLAECLVQTGYDPEELTQRIAVMVVEFGFSTDVMPVAGIYRGQIPDDDREPVSMRREVVVAEVIVPTPLLTPKEREILQFLLQGFSNKQIAKALNCTEFTVKWHLKNMFPKLGAGSRRHAVERARVMGIIESN
ncbi:LuxR family maltose regulon positive regulatory protein [Silvimonas terrae]|uniref:LuxR family maltose regulon positive regulatory protein n=1 Tax=Silvimonas terrae TaxID=300266 RepID=A0A840R9K6_9NEIS|nr:LuxR C-terminal-related transcriptional regulator [Silvimonas terrae]MBB5189587.1 LuxR family maltose regulon positive regulatory protein [Silvimonas terrae]